MPLDDFAKKAGLDLADFDRFAIEAARYPKYNNGLFMVPMDLMSLQPEYNVDHVKEAGLDPDKFPEDGAARWNGRRRSPGGTGTRSCARAS